MPTYEYKCKSCLSVTERINKVSDRKENTPDCKNCNDETVFMISTPMINSVSAARFENYQCPVTDEIVTSARQKKSIEAKHDLIIKEKGIYPPRKKKFVDETPEILKPELKKYQESINQ